MSKEREQELLDEIDALRSKLKTTRDKFEEYFDQSEVEKHRLKGLLDEAKDWICPHPNASEEKKLNPTARVWCIHCHRYLRDPSDATLIERIKIAIGIMD